LTTNFVIFKSIGIYYYRNDYYGGMWASFTFEALQKWLDECRNGKTEGSVKTSSPLVQDSEKSVTIGNQFSTVFNIEEKWFIPEYD
jgi:RAB protein geranylgeranyltransferase component A